MRKIHRTFKLKRIWRNMGCILESVMSSDMSLNCWCLSELDSTSSASLIEKTFLRLRRPAISHWAMTCQVWPNKNTHILAPKKCIWGYVFPLSEYRRPSERWCYLTQILLKALLFRYVFGNEKASPWTEFRKISLCPCWKELMILYLLSLLTT